MVLLTTSMIEHIQGVARSYLRAERSRLERADEMVARRRIACREEVTSFLRAQPEQSAPLAQVLAAMSSSPLLSQIHVARLVEEGVLECASPGLEGNGQEDPIIRIARC